LSDIVLNPKYAPLFDESSTCRYFIICGGRASAKSFSVSTAVCSWTTSEVHSKTLFTRYTMTAAHISIIPEFSQKIEMLEMNQCFDIQLKDIINLETSNSILFRGLKTSSGNQTANLKSIQGVTTWILDEAEELNDEDVFDKIDLSIREKNVRNRVIIILNPCHKKHWVYTRFFKERGVKAGHNGIVGDTCYIHTSYLDNAENLSASFLKQAERMKASNPLKYEHIFLGGWLDEIAGALWTWNMIHDYRVTAANVPELERVVVAIDPAVTANKNSDETGIVVAGAGVDGHYYVIEDGTLKASPLGWARVASALYHKHSADRVIGEVNNGGDMIETTLRQADRDIPYKSVRATRGKILRAEPIAALYENGLVHHVGTYTDMEAEMMTFTGAKSEASPNILDAMVWAMTELSAGKNRPFVSCGDEAEDVEQEPEELTNADYDDPNAWA